LNYTRIAMVGRCYSSTDLDIITDTLIFVNTFFDFFQIICFYL